MNFFTPKNFKRGRLIFNRYRPIDLIIFLVGVTITLVSILIYMLMIKGGNFFVIIGLMIPALIATSLILPFSIYHNLMEFFYLLFVFSVKPKKFIWEGVYKYEEEKSTNDKA